MKKFKFLKISLIIPLLCIVPGVFYSQNDINRILEQISVNNKLIQAGNELIAARKSEFNNGLAPYDPFVSYSHLFGSPVEAGNQKEFSLLFTFDFPSVYGKRSDLAELKTSQLLYEKILLRQDILLNAKISLLELTALNRKNEALNERLIIASRIYEYLRIKLDKGEIDIMEVNKAKLQVINYSTEKELNNAEMNSLRIRLTELNGGKQVNYNDTAYPVPELISGFDILESEIENSDPVLKKLNYDLKINKLETDIQSALKLPKIELGYRYQGILNENFHGFQAGISLPLWEKNNTVTTKELYSKYTRSLIEQHKNEHYSEIKQLYSRVTSYDSSLSEVKYLFQTIDNVKLYEKAFILGEISSPEYLLETTYYYSIQDRIENMEKEYHILQAKLFKHKL